MRRHTALPAKALMIAMLIGLAAPLFSQDLLAGDADSWDYQGIYVAMAELLDRALIDRDTDAQRELTEWTARVRQVSEDERDAPEVDKERVSSLIRQTVRGDARFHSQSLDQVREARVALLEIFASRSVENLLRSRDIVLAGSEPIGFELVTVEFRAGAGIEKQAMDRLGLLAEHHDRLTDVIEVKSLWEASSPTLYRAYLGREESLRGAIESDLSYMAEYYHLLRRSLSRKRDSVDGQEAIRAMSELLQQMSRLIVSQIEPSFTRTIGMRTEPVKELYWLQDHADYQLLDEICKRGNLASLEVETLLIRAEGARKSLLDERLRATINTKAVPKQQLTLIVEPLNDLYGRLNYADENFLQDWEEELKRLHGSIPWQEVFPVLQLPTSYATQYRELEQVCGELAARRLSDSGAEGARNTELQRFLLGESALLKERLDELYGPEDGEPRVVMHPVRHDSNDHERNFFFLGSLYRMFVDLKVELQIERGVVVYGDAVFMRIEKALAGMRAALLSFLSREWDGYFAEAGRLLALESQSWQDLLPAFLNQSLDKFTRARNRVQRFLEILASLEGTDVSRDWVSESIAEQQRRFQRLLREADSSQPSGNAAALAAGLDRVRFKLVTVLQGRVASELEAAGFPVRLADKIAQGVGVDEGERTVMLPSTLDRALQGALRRIEVAKLQEAFGFEDGMRALAAPKTGQNLIDEISGILDYLKLEAELGRNFADFDIPDFVARYEEAALANGGDLIEKWRQREVEGAGQSWQIDVSGPIQALLSRLDADAPELQQAQISFAFSQSGRLLVQKRGPRYYLGMGAVGGVFVTLRSFLGQFREQLGSITTGPFASDSQDPIEARLSAWYEEELGAPLFQTYFSLVGPGNLQGRVELIGIAGASRGPITFEERWSSSAEVKANPTSDGAIEWTMAPRSTFEKEICSFALTGEKLGLLSPAARRVLLGRDDVLLAGKVEVVVANVPSHGDVLLLVPMVLPVDLESGRRLDLKPFRDETTPWALDVTWLVRLSDPKWGFIDPATGAFKINVQLSIDNPKSLARVGVPVQVAGVDGVQRSDLPKWEFHWFVEDQGRNIAKIAGADAQALITAKNRGNVIVYCIGIGPNGELAAGDEDVTFQENTSSPVVFGQLWVSANEPIKGETPESRVDFAPGQAAYLCVRFETRDVKKADLYFEVEMKGRTVENLSTQRVLRDLEDGLHEEFFLVTLPHNQAKFSGELIFKSTITRYEGSRTISDSKTAPHTFRIWNPLTITSVEMGEGGQTSFEEWERIPIVVQADAGDLASEGAYDATLRISILDAEGNPVPGMQAEKTLKRQTDRDMEFSFDSLTVPSVFTDNQLCSLHAELSIDNKQVVSQQKLWLVPNLHILEVAAESRSDKVEISATVYVLVKDGDKLLVTRRIYIDGREVHSFPARVRRYPPDRPMETRFVWDRPADLSGEVPFRVVFEADDGRVFEKSGKILIRRE